MMDTIKINHGKAEMIAHRGLSGIEMENTAAAFVAAANRSYFGIETDVQETADGGFVLMHDHITTRSTGVEMTIKEALYDDIRSLQVKSSYGEGRADLVVPNLQEYVDICKRYGKKCVLEIKENFSLDSIKKMLRVIEELEYLEGVIFISFGKENLIMLRELLPEQPIQFLCGEYNDEVKALLDTYRFDLDIYHEPVTKEMVEDVHARGHLINCWTVDDKARAEELISWGVDFITTNILE